MSKLRISLLGKIYLATAVALTALFAAAGWFFLYQASEALHAGVEKEVRASLGTVEASLESRTEHLSTASSLLATMSDVRAAFGTGDTATIRDTAGEFWERARVGHGDVAAAAFVVAGPGGAILASVAGRPPSELNVGRQLPAGLLGPARRAFPKQSAAFAAWGDTVWQVLVTPVYVDSATRPALLNILVAAYPVTEETLQELKSRTGGVDFLLRTGGRTALRTVAPDAAAQIAAQPDHFAIHRSLLRDGEGNSLGELWAVRSFGDVEARVEALRRTMMLAWLGAMSVGLGLSFWLARRIVRPIHQLNEAAQQISRENYAVRVPEDSQDELGVLARTFNRMSASIQESRDERVRSGQIAAIGRLAASIAHDLRNPLAAVTGGAEMLAEFDLSPEQVRQTATQVHNAARRMEKLLEEVGQVARSKSGEPELCQVSELVDAAVETQEARASQQGVRIRVEPAGKFVVRCQRSRLERVLVNLISNALEVMPKGGELKIEVSGGDGVAMIDLSDTGPGIPDEIRVKLFEPFVTMGKKNGLGLGLALARQTMLDHAGSLELVETSRGAQFRVKIPTEDRATNCATRQS